MAGSMNKHRLGKLSKGLFVRILFQLSSEIRMVFSYRYGEGNSLYMRIL